MIQSLLRCPNSGQVCRAWGLADCQAGVQYRQHSAPVTSLAMLPGSQVRTMPLTRETLGTDAPSHQLPPFVNLLRNVVRLYPLLSSLFS